MSPVEKRHSHGVSRGKFEGLVADSQWSLSTGLSIDCCAAVTTHWPGFGTRPSLYFPLHLRSRPLKEGSVDFSAPLRFHPLAANAKTTSSWSPNDRPGTRHRGALRLHSEVVLALGALGRLQVHQLAISRRPKVRLTPRRGSHGRFYRVDERRRQPFLSSTRPDSGLSGRFIATTLLCCC
jgi:hypothetical protein